MTAAIAVVGALACCFALGSLLRQVDGAMLRRWRLSRRWDVSRLAREFIKIADEPLATLRGLTHMINAWERGARRPSERYWLLYLTVFPECANGEMSNGAVHEAGELLATAESNAVETTTPSWASSEDSRDVSALAATVSALEQQIAGLSRRLEELSRAQYRKGQPPKRIARRRKPRPGHWGWNGISLWTALIPSLALTCHLALRA
jgi:hypothetical protein